MLRGCLTRDCGLGGYMKRKVVEVYSDPPDYRFKMTITDYRDRMDLLCVWRRGEGRVHAATHKGDYRDPRRREERGQLVSDFIKRALEKAPRPQEGLAEDTELRQVYPALYAFLTCTAITGVDGERIARQTATLNVFVSDGVFKCFLNDRASQRCLCVSSRAFYGLWEALENALTAEDPGWRFMEPRGDGKHGTRKRKGS